MEITFTPAHFRRLNNLAGIHSILWSYNKTEKLFSCEEKTFQIFESVSETSEADLFEKLYSHESFKSNFEGLVLKNKKIDITLSFNFEDTTEWLRVIGTKAKDEDTFIGSIFNITKEIRREISHRNQTIEVNAYEKGLEEFSIVARTDRRGRILYANKEFCRLSKSQRKNF